MAALTSKQRSYLRKLAAEEDAIFSVGKASLTPEMTEELSNALEARELIKITQLKNNFDDIHELAEMIAGRTRSQVVTVIGRKMVFYRESKTKKKIELPC